MSARFLVLPALFVGALCSSGLSQEAGADSFAPESRDISHFTQIWERSPFIVETVAIVQSPALATKYSLVGLVSSKSESFAFLVDKQESDPLKSRLMLSQKKPDTTRNLELVSISPNRIMSDSTVVIRQGGEEATIRFDDAVLNSSGLGVQPGSLAGGGAPIIGGGVPHTPPVPQHGGAVVPPQPGSTIRSAGGAPPVNVPIPSPGIVPPAPQPGQPSAVPNTAAGQQPPPTPTRRIIRPKPINVDN